MSIPSSSMSLVFPRATLRPSTSPVTPLPVTEDEVLRFGQLDAALLRPIDDGRRQGVFAAPLKARRKTQHLLLAGIFPGRLDRDELRLALGQGPRLVDDEGVDLAHDLDGLGVLEEHPQGGPLAGGDHDRHGRRESEGAGAGNDEDGHGVDQGVGQPRVRPPDGPADEG